MRKRDKSNNIVWCNLLNYQWVKNRYYNRTVKIDDWLRPRQLVVEIPRTKPSKSISSMRKRLVRIDSETFEREAKGQEITAIRQR
jgi:hypothetical protein